MNIYTEKYVDVGYSMVYNILGESMRSMEVSLLREKYTPA